MGLFGKYIAVRWASRGPGGPSSDGDGGSGLALFFLIIGAIMGVVLLFGYVLAGIGSLVYETIRPVLMVSPPTSVVVGGILLGSIFLAIPKYPRDAAKGILTADRRDRNTTAFYLRHLLLVGLMGVIVYHVAKTGGELPSVWIQNYTDNLLVHLVGNVTYGVAFFYVIYSFFHLPYRYHRLVRYAPFGTAYTIVTVFPVTATLVISFFDLPVKVTDAAQFSTLGILVIAAGISIPYVLPLVFIKFKAEPDILGLDVHMNDAVDEP